MFKSVTLVTPVTLIYKAILSKKHCNTVTNFVDWETAIYFMLYMIIMTVRYIRVYVYCPTLRTLAPETMNFPNLCRTLPI